MYNNFRFGDFASDKQKLEAEIDAQVVAVRQGTGRWHGYADRVKREVDWGAFFARSPEWARGAYLLINQYTADPDSRPTLDSFLGTAQASAVVPLVIVNRPLPGVEMESREVFQPDPPASEAQTVVAPQNVGVPNPPGKTNAEYEIEAKQAYAEAARANSLRDAPRPDAFQENPPETGTPALNVAPTSKPSQEPATAVVTVPEGVKTPQTKSFILPALAALAAYMLVKG